METPPQGGGVNLEEVWPGGSGPVYIRGDNTLSALILPHASSFAASFCIGRPSEAKFALPC